jgi:hypothetical protein
MSSHTYERPLNPVDKTAALVIQKASHIHRFNDTSLAHKQQECFKTRISEILAKLKIPSIPSTIKNFTGKRYGRIEVIAYSHLRVKMKKSGRDPIHYWVVRCDCGEYEMRRHTALNRKDRGERDNDECMHCKRLDFLKRNAAYRAQMHLKNS